MAHLQTIQVPILLHHADLSKILGAKWNALPPEEKKKWQIKAEEHLLGKLSYLILFSFWIGFLILAYILPTGQLSHIISYYLILSYVILSYLSAVVGFMRLVTLQHTGHSMEQHEINHSFYHGAALNLSSS